MKSALKGYWNIVLSGGRESSTALLISGYSLDILNRYVYVFFDPDVYKAGGGAVTVGDFQVSNFAANGGASLTLSFSAIADENGDPLSGGEQTVRLTLSGTTGATGSETFEVQPSGANVYQDVSGNLNSPNDTTGTITLETDYDADYKTVLALALTNGDPVPVKSVRLLESAAMASARTAGWLTLLDGLHFTSSNFEWSRYDFVSKTKRATITNTLQLVPFQGQASFAGNSYLGFGWVASVNGVNYQQNSASLIVVVQNNDNTGAVSMYLIGANGTSGGVNIGRMGLTGRSSADQARYTANHNTSSASITDTSAANSEGVHHVDRNAASGADSTVGYLNGTQVGTSTAASSALTERELIGHGINNNGTPGSFDANKFIQAFAWGASLRAHKDSVSTVFNTLKTGLTALIPSFAGKVTTWAGQSNGNTCGKHLLTELSAPQTAIYNNGDYSIANGWNCNHYVWDGSQWDLVNPQRNGNTDGTIYFSPFYAFCYAEDQKVANAGNDLFYIMQAWSGSGLYAVDGTTPNWIDGGPVSSRWYLYKQQYDNAIAAMATPSYGPFIWIQGEKESADYDDGTQAAAYYDNIHDTFRPQVLVQTSHTEIAALRCNVNLNVASYPYKATVITAQNDLKTSGDYDYMANGDDLDFSSPHYSTIDAMIAVGERMSALVT